MNQPVALTFIDLTLETLAQHAGLLAILADGEAPATPAPRKLDRATRGMLARAMASAEWARAKPGEALTLAFPAGLAAEILMLVKLPRKADAAQARKAGATIGRALGTADALVLAESHATAAGDGAGADALPRQPLPQMWGHLAHRARWALCGM